MSGGGGGDDGLPEEHEEHVNHEAWVIPYADLLTLLMAMFIALFAMSTVDVTKFKAFAVGFNEALGGGKLDAGIGGSGKATSPVVGQGNGNGPFTGGQITPGDNSKQSVQSILDSLAQQKAAQQQQQQALTDVKQEIDNAANKLGLGGSVQTKQRNDGLEVTLLTDRVLFASGHDEIQPEGDQLLKMIGQVLASIDNPIVIQGYTDSQAINSDRFPNNFYLSGGRAIAVLEFFAGLGIDPHRLRAEARGDLDPIATNATAEGRAKNRRVEILVQSKIVQKTLDAAGINDKEAGATPPTTAAVAPSTGGATPNLNPGLGAQ